MNIEEYWVYVATAGLSEGTLSVVVATLLLFGCAVAYTEFVKG